MQMAGSYPFDSSWADRASTGAPELDLPVQVA